MAQLANSLKKWSWLIQAEHDIWPLLCSPLTWKLRHGLVLRGISSCHIYISSISVFLTFNFARTLLSPLAVIFFLFVFVSRMFLTFFVKLVCFAIRLSPNRILIIIVAHEDHSRGSGSAQRPECRAAAAPDKHPPGFPVSFSIVSSPITVRSLKWMFVLRHNWRPCAHKRCLYSRAPSVFLLARKLFLINTIHLIDITSNNMQNISVDVHWLQCNAWYT